MSADLTLVAVAVIPARGGSKRIPRKNVRPFCGRPILLHSIEAALGSGCFDEVMVSTDDEEIAELARGAGAAVPFLRSPATANDHAGLADVLVEVLETYAQRGRRYETCCCLLPTAPFVTAQRLREGRERLLATGADVVLPVVAFSYPIQRALRVVGDHCEMMWPENYARRSQDLEPAYHDSGQFYWARSASLLAQRKLFAAHTVAMPLSSLEVQDIDTEEDWRLAEMKFRMLREGAP